MAYSPHDLRATGEAIDHDVVVHNMVRMVIRTNIIHIVVYCVVLNEHLQVRVNRRRYSIVRLCRHVFRRTK